MGIDDDQLRQQAQRNATNAAISHVVSQHTSSVAPAPVAPSSMSGQPAQVSDHETIRLVASSGSSHDIWWVFGDQRVRMDFRPSRTVVRLRWFYFFEVKISLVCCGALGVTSQQGSGNKQGWKHSTYSCNSRILRISSYEIHNFIEKVFFRIFLIHLRRTSNSLQNYRIQQVSLFLFAQLLWKPWRRWCLLMR